jgi:hypothetical protein
VLLLISRGEGPRTSCGASCDDEQMGEVNRVLLGSRKSAEPIKAGRAGTSDPRARPGQRACHGKGNRTDGGRPVQEWNSPTRKWAGRFAAQAANR